MRDATLLSRLAGTAVAALVAMPFGFAGLHPSHPVHRVHPVHPVTRNASDPTIFCTQPIVVNGVTLKGYCYIRN
jgi:hypothetical protein